MVPGWTEVQVRSGTEDDLTALTEIYNHYVRETPITFDTATFTPGQRRPWLRSYPEDGPHRLRVARDVLSGRVLGYATSSPLRPKAAYSTSVEVTVYCADGAAGRGVGTLLYEALFKVLEGEDVHRAYAGIVQGVTPADGGGRARRSGCTSASASGTSVRTARSAASSAGTGTSPGTRRSSSSLRAVCRPGVVPRPPAR